MRKRRPPSAAYFEILYIQLAVGVVCAAILFATGNVVAGIVFLAAVAVLFVGLTKYRSRTQRGTDA